MMLLHKGRLPPPFKNLVGNCTRSPLVSIDRALETRGKFIDRARAPAVVPSPCHSANPPGATNRTRGSPDHGRIILPVLIVQP